MKWTKQIISEAFRDFRPALAYSGGGDSTVLLDIVFSMGHRPPLIYVDSQMEHGDNFKYVQGVAQRYGLALHHAKAAVSPQECWQKHGYPMLGKLAARIWMQRHKAEVYGFKVDVSTCCRIMKIKPGRDMARQINCNAMLTGQRGAQDDALRGLREIKDGAICVLKQDRLVQVNPLLGWTDTMIRRYAEQHGLPANPLRTRGAMTIGCMYCGGGAQFDNSGFRVLRKIDPSNWRRMIVELGFGPIIIAIKYGLTIDDAREAIAELGGLEKMVAERPHVFDFLRKTPMKGYDR